MQSSKHWWIRMLEELTEYGKSIREEMKATLTEIKEVKAIPEVKQRKIYRESTVKGRKLGFKSMIWNKNKKDPGRNEGYTK